MANPNNHLVSNPAAFDAYCIRHAVDPYAAVAELVNMALGLPVDVLDYLRDRRSAGGAAA